MKFMGSKARLSKDIAPIINNLIKDNNIATYIEPFVGGANMMQHIKCDKRVGSDANDYLIEMWTALQSGYQPPNHISKIEYDNVKDNKESFNKELVAIVGFCATYNAKWFGGYAGIVTTKANTVRNYYDESIRNLQKQLPMLEDVLFKYASYDLYKDIKGALIYCDPTYQATTQYD